MKFLMDILIGTLFSLIAVGMTYKTLTYKPFNPAFKVGECIRFLDPGNEFEEPKLLGDSQEVLKIGDKGFLVKDPDGELDYVIYQVQDLYVKVNCATGDLTK